MDKTQVHFKDPWIPRPPSFLPMTRGVNDNVRVSEFIQTPGKWNRELIQQSFLLPDSQLILTIPLSPFDHIDSWLWHYNKNGSYTVKSGYKLALNTNTFNPSSSSGMLSAWWRAYWAIKIPRKVLTFRWRGFQEILPTTKGLQRMNISAHNNCPLCGFGEESNVHAVFWCPFAQEVWALVDYPFLAGHKEDISFKDVLFYAIELLNKEGFDKMLMIAWGIWTERNKKTHGQQFRAPPQIKMWIFSYYEEIKNAWVVECGASSGDKSSTRDTTDAEIQDFTLFVDVAISTSTEMVCLGAVIYSANKKIQAALSKPLQGVLSVFHAEALALLVGLRWAQTFGLPIKFISSDSLSLVQALNSTNSYYDETGILLTDIKMLLSDFPGASISHVGRKFNVEAHNLSKQALQLEAEISWVEEIPQQDEEHS